MNTARPSGNDLHPDAADIETDPDDADLVAVAVAPGDPDGTALTASEAAAVNARLEEWRDGYRPVGPREEWLYRRIVVASVRLDRCFEDESAMIAYQAGRASACWDDDRRVEAEQAAATLSRRPSLTVSRLRRTRAGCDWLIAQWRGLAAAADWDDARTARALDLLGVSRDCRHAGHEFDLAPADLAAREVERLESLRSDGLDALDSLERELAEAGHEVSPGRERLRLRSYEAACQRAFDTAQRQLTACQKARAASPEPQPRPTFEVGPPDPVEDASTRAIETRRAFERELLRYHPPGEPLPAVPSMSPSLPTSAAPPAPASPAARTQPSMNRRQRRAALRRERQR